jgi:hypothetical protein
MVRREMPAKRATKKLRKRQAANGDWSWVHSVRETVRTDVNTCVDAASHNCRGGVCEVTWKPRRQVA